MLLTPKFVLPNNEPISFRTYLEILLAERHRPSGPPKFFNFMLSNLAERVAKSRRYQKGIIIGPTGAMGGGLPDPSCADYSISDLESPMTTDADSEIRFLTDGDLTIIGNLSSSPLADEWLPASAHETAIGSNYEFRATNVSGSNPNVGDAMSTWLTGTSVRNWGYNEPAPGPGNISGVFDVDLGFDGEESAVDTGRITGSAGIA